MTNQLITYRLPIRYSLMLLISSICYVWLLYRDEFMEDPSFYFIMVPNDIQFQRHLLKVYQDSRVCMHRGREATYGCLSYDFYWRKMAKHVRNWIRRCPACIKFKSIKPKHGPVQIRFYDCNFNTVGIDCVGQLPTTPTGDKLMGSDCDLSVL